MKLNFFILNFLLISYTKNLTHFEIKNKIPQFISYTLILACTFPNLLSLHLSEVKNF